MPTLSPYAKLQDFRAGWSRHTARPATTAISYFGGTAEWPLFWQWSCRHLKYRRLPVKQLRHTMLGADWTVGPYKVSDGYLRDVCRRINPHLFGLIASLADCKTVFSGLTSGSALSAHHGRSPVLALRIFNECVVQFQHLFSEDRLCLWDMQICHDGTLYPGLVVGLESGVLQKMQNAWHAILAVHCGVLAARDDLQDMHSAADPFYREFLQDVERLSGSSPFAGKSNRMLEVSTTPVSLSTTVQEEDCQMAVLIPSSRLGRPELVLNRAWRAETMYRMPRLHLNVCYLGLAGGKTYEIGNRCLCWSGWPEDGKFHLGKSYGGHIGRRLENHTAEGYNVQSNLTRMKDVAWNGDRRKLSRALRFILSHGMAKASVDMLYDQLALFVKEIKLQLEDWPQTVFELWDGVFEFSASCVDACFRRMLAKACWNFVCRARWEVLL